MILKKTMVIVLASLLFQINSYSQDLFYYSEGKKQLLSEDRSSVIVQYKKGISPTARFSNKALKSSIKTKMYEDKSTAILNFDGAQNKSAQDLTVELELDQSLIQHVSYAVQYMDGTRLWPTSQILLEVKEGHSLSELEELMVQYDASYINTSFNNMVILETKETGNAFALANLIYESNVVKWAHPDFIMEFHNDLEIEDVIMELTPTDPLYSEQFQMHNTGQTIDGFSGTNDIDCNAPEAWDITTGSSSIVVAVIDDGVESHEDLGTVLTGYDAVTNSSGGQPGNSDAHGQACAGIIAASHNGLGVAGLAPNVQILPVRGLAGGGGSFSDLAEGINWATDNGADVLSNSWGSASCGTSNDAIASAISNAVNNGRGGLGSVVVFASGNSQQCYNCVGFPATNANVLAVGAIGNAGNITTYSQRGSQLDLVAPSIDGYYANSNSCSSFVVTGAGVRTIDRQGNSGYVSGNYYDFFGGTSAACPVVSGVAALVLSVNPNLTESEVRSILNSTAIDMGSSGFDNTYGNGRVNAYGAVLAAGGSTCTLSAPSNFSSSNITNSSFVLSWNSVSGAANYTVTIDGNANTVSGTSFSATGLTSGTSYSCSVVANCSGGGSGAVSSITVTTNGTTPTPDCDALSFTGVSLVSHSNSDDGIYSVVDDATVLLEENTWRSYLLDYSVTSNTVVSFEFQSTGSEGEIHGIAFASSSSASSDLTFKVYGDQNWGITDYDNYPGSGWVTYNIPVGDFYTGTYDRLVFCNDNDGGSGNNSYFRNVVIHEGECNSAATTFSTLEATSTSENEFDQLEISLFPIPSSNELNIMGRWDNELMYSIISLSGKQIGEGVLAQNQNKINISALESGTYLFKVITEEGEFVGRFIKE